MTQIQWNPCSSIDFLGLVLELWPWGTICICHSNIGDGPIQTKLTAFTAECLGFFPIHFCFFILPSDLAREAPHSAIWWWPSWEETPQGWAQEWDRWKRAGNYLVAISVWMHWIVVSHVATVSHLVITACSGSIQGVRQSSLDTKDHCTNSSSRYVCTVYTGKIAAFFGPRFPAQNWGCGDLSRGRLPPVISHSTLTYVCHYPGSIYPVRGWLNNLWKGWAMRGSYV